MSAKFPGGGGQGHFWPAVYNLIPVVIEYKIQTQPAEKKKKTKKKKKKRKKKFTHFITKKKKKDLFRPNK